MSKFSELQGWMKQHNVTFVWAAEQLSVSPSLLSKILRGSRMSPKRHAQLVALRFPEEYLPDPIPAAPGPKRAVPDWLEE